MASHRYSMSGLDVQELEQHGRETADKRYGPLQNRDGAKPPADRSQVQGCGDPASAGVPAKGYPRDVPNTGWLRGKNEDATTKPGYVPGYKGGK
jgi:hypothetical protein